MKQPILSICIPTYKRPDLLKKTLDSILLQKYQEDLYEICISDDSPDNETEMLLQTYNVKNLIYQHILPINSYMNLIEVLRMGSGIMLKLVNDYSCFSENSISTMIEDIQNNIDEKNVVFWGSQFIQCEQEKRCDSLNSFLKNVGIYATYALCFGIWKYDFDRMIDKIDLDQMFPHVSLLVENKNKKGYYIDNRKIFSNQEIPRKGGYNIPEAFGYKYLNIMKKLLDQKMIFQETFDIQKRLTIQFIVNWKVNCTVNANKYYFDFENEREYLGYIFNDDELKSYDIEYENLLKKVEKRR